MDKISNFSNYYLDIVLINIFEQNLDSYIFYCVILGF